MHPVVHLYVLIVLRRDVANPGLQRRHGGLSNVSNVCRGLSRSTRIKIRMQLKHGMGTLRNVHSLRSGCFVYLQSQNGIAPAIQEREGGPAALHRSLAVGDIDFPLLVKPCHGLTRPSVLTCHNAPVCRCAVHGTSATTPPPFGSCTPFL